MSESKPVKWLVRAAVYNNRKDVLFMMKSDDFRFNDGNYIPIAPGKFDNKTKTLTINDGVYQVYADWSVKLLKEQVA